MRRVLASQIDFRRGFDLPDFFGKSLPRHLHGMAASIPGPGSAVKGRAEPDPAEREKIDCREAARRVKRQRDQKANPHQSMPLGT